MGTAKASIIPKQIDRICLGMRNEGILTNDSYKTDNKGDTFDYRLESEHNWSL